jgi:serine/threonine protein kinase
VLVDQVAKPESIARFEKEARTVAKLRHPNLVTAYDFGQHRGRLFLVMELLDGENLEARVSRIGRMDEATAWWVIRQAASGLAHAHELGVVHRDIKPANLILVQPPAGYQLPAGVDMVKITDFGLALFAQDAAKTSRLTVAGVTLGTPIYMAPEQFSQANVDCRADIYALGATIWHLIDGRPPFEGGTAWEIMVRKIERKPQLDALISIAGAPSVDLISAMLANEPGKRPASYAELLERIDALPVVQASLPASGSAASSGASGTNLTGLKPTTFNPRLTAPRRKRSRARLAVLTAIPLLLLAIAYFSWAIINRGPASMPMPMPTTASAQSSSAPKMVPTETLLSLFDGETLTGWLTAEGQWTRELDEEKTPVLAGRGICRRKLTTRFPHYQLRLGADLQKATAVELHFAVRRADGADQSRYVLRMAADGVSVGERSSDHGPWQLRSNVVPYPKREERANDTPYLELRVDRQGTIWLAYFNNGQIGQLPADADKELDEFRLVTEGGPAFFETIELRELRPASAGGK